MQSSPGFRAAISSALLIVGILTACAPTPLANPLPTAATIIEITPAPTLAIDATATVYAQQLVPTPTPAGLYIVQRGDTLSGLASEFGTTVAEIMAANGLTDENALQIGQPLIIPSLLPGTPVRGTLPPIIPPSQITPTPTVSTP